MDVKVDVGSGDVAQLAATAAINVEKGGFPKRSKSTVNNRSLRAGSSIFADSQLPHNEVQCMLC